MTPAVGVPERAKGISGSRMGTAEEAAVTGDLRRIPASSNTGLGALFGSGAMKRVSNENGNYLDVNLPFERIVKTVDSGAKIPVVRRTFNAGERLCR